ncbi:hypothetical protein UFOVP181_420 [uncultured Caudovirales phage]|uniref:Uncharacterized protein n=1 Tax=uncultured Caudovirales phage TaxID=2100421 RepID=A0A6J7WHR1_9CAUD|nr:hypothetical protein UFOVP57_219 [uncultured Caudovirales phage]CAB5209321.1 hypothetical protein UFOVP181_420 [uncultured Caudovirales phage]
MQKISTYLYPNRVQLLADLASFNVEYTNVYQRQVKIYSGIDNTIEFDIKNADQKRIDLNTLSDIELNVMDASGQSLPNSPYTVTPTALKGIATVTIPADDLSYLDSQFFKYSVSCVKEGNNTLLYADSRFGAVGTIELVGSAMPVYRNSRVYESFTAEIDLKGVPTWHTSAIPAKFYEAVPTETISFSIDLTGFVGSVWIEATKSSTISVESFKHGSYLRSFTAMADAPATTTLSFNNIRICDFSYFRVSYSTPISMGVGASFTATLNNNAYDVQLRAGGTGYSVGSQIKVSGSTVGGVDGINDLIITVTHVDASSAGYTSSYAVSSITSFTVSGVAANGDATYIVTGTNISGTVDKVTVS